MGNDNKPPLGENNYKNEIFIINDEIQKNAYDLEIELFSKFVSPLTEKEMYYRDIPIDFHGNNFLHTLICYNGEETQKEIFVGLHGFQGNSLTFYKIFPLIYQKFTCYAPDLIGMGLSSRPNVEFTSPEMTNEYFIESIEAWRKSMNIDKFYLCGHSVGGYFAAIYALKYPEHIKDIILMAPSCITDISKGGDIHSNIDIGMKVGFRLIAPIWTFQPRLQDYSQKFLFKDFLNFCLRKRYNISKEESEITGKITELTYKYPKDTDQCLYYIFKHPIPTAHIPIEDELETKLQDKRILFVYGENDWMEKIGAERLCNGNKEKFKMFIIKQGHTFPLDNPTETADIINKYMRREDAEVNLKEIN